MTKGKSKTGSRSGSDSNNASRASASDRRHDAQKVRQDKSIKAGTEQRGKMKASEGGSKR
ncbi:MAG TPA: hypothetical protein VEB23_13900 [Ramlibacter sp.]|nr:hypothetical protein [Ramlibacter sp.]